MKAAAVLAQRAGDVITRSGQPHVYEPLPSDGTRMIGNYRVWLPPALRERDPKTGKWQALAPRPAKTCEVFGMDDTASAATWGDDRTDPQDAYAWTLWRPYSCCRRAGQFFLFAITF